MVQLKVVNMDVVRLFPKMVIVVGIAFALTGVGVAGAGSISGRLLGDSSPTSR